MQRPRDPSRQRPCSWRTCTRSWRPSAKARPWWVAGDVTRAGQGRREGTVPPPGVWQQSAAAWLNQPLPDRLINLLGVLITPQRIFTKCPSVFTKSPRVFPESLRLFGNSSPRAVRWVDKIPAREQHPVVPLCLSRGLEAVGSTSQRGFCGFPVGSMNQWSCGSSCRWTSSCSSCSTREPTC